MHTPSSTTFPEPTTTPPQVVAARIAAAVFAMTLLLGLVPFRAVAGTLAHTPPSEPVGSPTVHGEVADVACRVDVGRPGLQPIASGDLPLTAQVRHGSCLATANGFSASPDLVAWEAEVQRCVEVSHGCTWRTTAHASDTTHRADADLSTELVGEVTTACRPGRHRVRARTRIVLDGDLSTSGWATSPVVDVTC